jgi:hypothetical protein
MSRASKLGSLEAWKLGSVEARLCRISCQMRRLPAACHQNQAGSRPGRRVTFFVRQRKSPKKTPPRSRPAARGARAGDARSGSGETRYAALRSDSRRTFFAPDIAGTARSKGDCNYNYNGQGNRNGNRNGNGNGKATATARQRQGNGKATARQRQGNGKATAGPTQRAPIRLSRTRPFGAMRFAYCTLCLCLCLCLSPHRLTARC